MEKYLRYYFSGVFFWNHAGILLVITLMASQIKVVDEVFVLVFYFLLTTLFEVVLYPVIHAHLITGIETYDTAIKGKDLFLYFSYVICYSAVFILTSLFYFSGVNAFSGYFFPIEFAKNSDIVLLGLVLLLVIMSNFLYRKLKPKLQTRIW